MARPALDFVKTCAEKVGVSISFLPPPFSFERHLRDYLHQMGINVVLDVGAFTGTYATRLRKLGYEGQIISFEPVPNSYAQMQEKMQGDPLWKAMPVGLSDSTGETLINTYSDGHFNSLLNLRNQSEEVYGMDPSGRSQTPIVLRRLDEILDELIAPISSPKIFLKIDTQGHDVSVMRGASGVMEKITGLQSELAAVELYEGMPTMSQALEYYRKCGFVPIGFYPIHTYWDNPITPEFDVLLSRFDGRLGPS
jgi:FkbM family methyltransferase